MSDKEKGCCKDFEEKACPCVSRETDHSTLVPVESRKECCDEAKECCAPKKDCCPK